MFPTERAILPQQTFAARLLDTFNAGGLCLMISIGHRTGLFDAMRSQPPMTSAQLADRAGLNERYVREWLGAMATGGVVEVDAAGTYRLPDEHAAHLSRAAGADNLAVLAQYFAVLGGVEDAVVECFARGGGVPYERYPRFHEVMAEDSGQSALAALESHVLPLVPGLAERLARGGILVLDLGCGRGKILMRLAELYPASGFVGVDLSQDAIRHARAEAARRGLANVQFLVADLSDFDEKAKREAFDLVMTFDAIHDQARPLNVLTGIARTLRPGGTYLMQEIKGSSHVHKNVGHPIGTLLYAISCMHCMTVSLAQGGEGLGAMWGEEKAREYLARAGFRSVEKHELTHDVQNDWYVARK